MELEGKLSSFSLPEVLQFLSMGKMTGTLTLKHHNNKVSLLIKEGKIINATQIKSRRLGQMLVESGYLKRSQLDSAVSIQRKTKDAMLGQIILDQGYVKKEDIEQTLRLQIEEEIWDLFSWDEGEFKFEYGIEPRFDDRLVEIDIQPLLLEGSRRQDEWSKIKKHIPDETGIVRLVPPQEDFDFDLQLTANEWRVLSMIDGHTSVMALCNRSGLGRFDTYRILSTFLSSGIVEIVPLQEELQDVAQRSPASAPDENVGQPEMDVSEEPAVGGGRGVSASDSQVLRLMPPLFGRKRTAGKSERVASQVVREVVSPVGAVAVLINRYLQAIARQKEFENEDSLFLFRLWRPIIEDYPKADLVRMCRDRVDVSQFERFVEETEMSPAINACYEDTLDALMRFFRIVAQISNQRLGARAAQQLWNDVAGPGALRLVIKYNSDFDAQRELAAQMSASS
ncbi:MAG: hypothetical protein Kow0059_17850 [Candidatus Sumerlaeia bacterium]